MIRLDDIGMPKIVQMAEYLVENDTSLQGLEVEFGIDRKIIHRALNCFMMQYEHGELYEKVREVLERNKHRTGCKSPYMVKLSKIKG